MDKIKKNKIKIEIKLNLILEKKYCSNKLLRRELVISLL